MQTVSIVLAFVLVALTRAGGAEKPLNILILYADDLGYGDLACYNPGSKIPTPNLDRLAASGMRFTDGHSSSGVCTPSRYAMLTGRHHWRDFHGIVDALGKSVFKTEQLTMPEMLKQHGYTTACFGKWHLGWDWNAIRKPGTPRNSIQPGDFDWTAAVPDGPLAHGFDHYFGDETINFPPYAWIENDRLLRAPDAVINTRTQKPTKEGSWEARPGPALSDWDFYKVLPTVTQRSVDWLRGRKGKEQPFFLYVPFPSPHAPIIPNDEFDGKSKAGAFGDFVHQTDHACGEILKALDESGHAANTIVVFSADNGAENYAYARDEKFGHWSSAPLRGLKRDIYEGGHRVPFIIRWPGLTKAGTVSDALVSQIDLMATFAAAVGADLPRDAAEDSHDLLPLLKGLVTSARATHIHNTKPNAYAVRDGDWVLIDAKDGYGSRRDAAWEKRHGYPADDGGKVELYNLKTDLAQKHNVAAAHPDKVVELQALLKRLREQGHSAPRLSTTAKQSTTQ